jgi:DNA mismatch endonuclease, patch repair protein
LKTSKKNEGMGKAGPINTMADRISSEARSRNMSHIRAEDTAPEKRVRSLLYRMGCRFRLHRKDLPGTPDIVMPGRRAVIFVHGCFWHQHPGCRHARVPRTNRSYWERKLARNVARGRAAVVELEAMGWSVTVVWECETGNAQVLRRKLLEFLHLPGWEAQ